MVNAAVMRKAWEPRYRPCARSVARLLLAALDTVGRVEREWEVSDYVWCAIEAWLNTNPVNEEEFLRVFRARYVVSPDQSADESELIEGEH